VKTPAPIWFLAFALVACKRDDAAERKQPTDAQVSASVDASRRAADAVPAVLDGVPVDAGAPIDAAPVIDAAPPRDAGAARPKPRPAVDAATSIAMDAGPRPPLPDAGGGTPCRRKIFKTKLVGDACAEGGQAAAKAAMKKFTREAKKQESELDCKSCHEKLAPSYSLKDDALEHFERLGGE
jgi:hypothetical protein